MLLMWELKRSFRAYKLEIMSEKVTGYYNMTDKTGYFAPFVTYILQSL